MGKIIGLITAWAAEPFIEPALKQAIEYCDEVIVSVSANHKSFNKFADKTMEICKKYENDNKIKLVKGYSGNDHPSSKGITLKKMLDETNNNKAGNWIWILDADEFYFPEDVELFKKIIKKNEYGRIMVPEKFFLVNTKNYIKWNRDRLKILDKDNVSFRTNRVGNEKMVKTYNANEAIGMHHYSFLLNPYFKIAFWEREYGNPNLKNVKDKVKWMNDIYLKMDVNNQAPYVNKAKQLFNINSILGPIFAGGPWKPTKPNGEAFKYDDKHPKFVEDAGLTKINDF
ncbi:MAG: hypothetical protein ACOCVF_02170, partial [bacterium]